MGGLAFMLIIVIGLAWAYPNSVGRWLAKVHEGYRSAPPQDNREG